MDFSISNWIEGRTASSALGPSFTVSWRQEYYFQSFRIFISVERGDDFSLERE